LLLIGAALGAGGTRLAQGGKRPEETRFLNFDPESTNPADLSTGWSGFEHDERGTTWVWCTAESCTLFAEEHEQRDRLLRIHLWPARFPNAPPQVATANVNGTEVANVDMGEDPLVWSIPVGKKTWKDGRNVLRFDFSYAEAPAKRIPGATDARTLSASFDWLEIVPQ
jgi:hypothetical protein